MCDVSELIILVVDSDDRTQAEICSLLRELGAKRLVCESDALSALEMLTTEKDFVDVVITSHDLDSGQDGTQFISKVKEMYPDKICLMYSHESKTDAVDYLHALVVGSSAFFKVGSPGFHREFKTKVNTFLGFAQVQYDLSHKGACCGG